MLKILKKILGFNKLLLKNDKNSLTFDYWDAILTLSTKHMREGSAGTENL